MTTLKLFNLLALASVAILVLTSAPPSVNALTTDRSHVARSGHHHDAVLKRKRDSTTSNTSRCKPRPTSSSSTSSSASAYTPPAESSTSTTTTTNSPPASTPSTGKKWGLAVGDGGGSYLSTFAARPNVGFIYTWSPYLPSNLNGLQGCAMLWGYKQITQFQQLVVAGYANYVLGMNEPNQVSQSNMSPTDGVSLWTQYINPLKDQGYYLVSPACTNDQTGLDWMASFFELCSGCHVDAVAFHFYGTDAEAFITYATQLHNLYNLPIWVTEFADQNFSGGPQATLDEVYAFAATIKAFVDQTEWFTVAFPFGLLSNLQGVNDFNSLITSDGQPTSLAYTYFG